MLTVRGPSRRCRATASQPFDNERCGDGHQFLELGRFAVTYRITFGEPPSVTLQRDLRT
jgi:hypothetical protein